METRLLSTNFNQSALQFVPAGEMHQILAVINGTNVGNGTNLKPLRIEATSIAPI